jgi:hypothetical protein
MLKRIWINHRALTIGVSAIAVVVVLVASLLLVGGVRATSQASPTPTATATATPTESPSPSASPTRFVQPTPTVNSGPTPLPAGWTYSDLDGVAAAASRAHRLPLAIMVDDQAAARPQSGISSASIVYQAPADGAQDRYMMVFQEGIATDIGPVRSARPYFVFWAAEYHALYGHYGGDHRVLWSTIPGMVGKIYNMDALRYGGGCPFHRIKTRKAPHNAYTNTGILISCAAYKKYPATYDNLPDRPFRGDTAPSLLPTAQSISIAYRTCTIGYTFDPSKDSYLRSVDGKTEIDPANNSQVYARSVIVMYQAVSYDLSGEAPPHVNRPNVHNVGSGKALIFQEGKQINATWKKPTTTSLTRFYDSSGKEISLVRGEIFIQSIPTAYKVTVK